MANQPSVIQIDYWVLNKWVHALLNCLNFFENKYCSKQPASKKFIFGNHKDVIIIQIFTESFTVMITTGSPRTYATRTEIINVDDGYQGGLCADLCVDHVVWTGH